MSTYYTVKADPTCGNPDHIQTLTVGLSTGGWKFLLQGYPYAGDGHPILMSWADWRAFLEHRTILDEYGKELDLAAFTEVVDRTGYPPERRLLCRVAPTIMDIREHWSNCYPLESGYFHDAEGYDLTLKGLE